MSCPPNSAPDCDGVCNGPSILDCDGVCYDPTLGPPANYQDCAGVCNGTSILDCDLNCYDPENAEEPTTLKDCAGVCGGDATVGCDGICGSGKVYDCAGVCGGTSVPDCGENCYDPENGGVPTVVLDCTGTCGGTSTIDCSGTCGGTAFLNCGGTCITPPCQIVASGRQPVSSAKSDKPKSRFASKNIVSSGSIVTKPKYMAEMSIRVLNNIISEEEAVKRRKLPKKTPVVPATFIQKKDNKVRQFRASGIVDISSAGVKVFSAAKKYRQ